MPFKFLLSALVLAGGALFPVLWQRALQSHHSLPPPPAPVSGPPARTGAVIVEATQRTPRFLDLVTTPSGRWPVYDLGAVPEGNAYLFEYEGRPGWWSVCVSRAPGAERRTVLVGKKEREVPTIAQRRYAVSVAGDALTLALLPGSFRCADNGEPVEPSMERIAKAVAEKRVVPYGMRAFDGWPEAPKWKLTMPGAYAEYVPDRIYGRDPGHSAIGTVSAVGGEYSSSRGFLSGEDALMIAAALKGDRGLFKKVAAVARDQVLYGLTMDNFAIWSDAHDSLRDPQDALPGDKAYAVGTSKTLDHWGITDFWCAPEDGKYLDSLGAKPGKCYRSHRDGEHLFNHGYAYWLATGDPRAALLQEAIAAFALSAPYYGLNTDGSYRIQFAYQRWTLNIFTAMWKLRDVTEHMTTANGRIFWPKPRAQKMWTDILADWKKQLGELDASADPKAREMSALYGYDATPTVVSNFMAQGYGPEAAYLWASTGSGQAGALLTRLAEHMAWRVNALGGTLAMMGEGGSTFLDLRKHAGLATRGEIESYLVAAQPDRSRTSFDDSPYHYTLRAYWLLKMAQDAAVRGWIQPVAGVDEAIARMETMRARTHDWRDRSVLGWKHAAVTFTH